MLPKLRRPDLQFPVDRSHSQCVCCAAIAENFGFSANELSQYLRSRIIGNMGTGSAFPICPFVERTIWLVWLSENAFHHGCEVVAVIGANILKLETSSDTREDIAYSSFGDDSAIFDKKVELDGGIDWQDLLSFYKDTADAEVANTRSVFAMPTAPIGPDALRSIDSLVTATRVKDLFFHAVPPRSS
jgi:hypothetical protein